MWEEEQPQNAQNGMMMPGDPNANPAMAMPQYDPYQIEQIRQEIELAHEEFQRLLSGRPRLYSQFRY